MGKRITITGKDGFHFGAYLAEPEGKPKGGVVICQEIFGVNPYIESVCDFYTKAGYLTIAPALFDRVERDVDLKYLPEGRDRGIEIASKIDWDTALNDLAAARETIHSMGTQKCGAIGFCWGGSLAWLFACRCEIDCAVAYYGSEIEHFPNEHARHPVIMHIGEEDPVIPPEKLESIKKAQAGAHIFTYPKGSHGFDNQARPKYDAATVKLARERTLEFLSRHVG